MTKLRLTFLMLAALSCTGCETLSIGAGGANYRIEKDAKGTELQKETYKTSEIPKGCPTLTVQVPTASSGVTVSYKEPNMNADGTPLKDLQSTLILMSVNGQWEKEIQIWTNSWSGGADVIIHNLGDPGTNLGLCVVARDLTGNRSAPASLAP